MPWFKKEILNEIARCLGMPYNISAGNSSGYNYASGRLDHQTYFKAVREGTADLGFVEGHIEDPRIVSEAVRQWSTFHPEFTFLPRKFKIAANGAVEDRAATWVHDIGVHAVKNAQQDALRVLYSCTNSGQSCPMRNVNSGSACTRYSVS